MGRHNSHLPQRPYDKQANPDDTRSLTQSDRKRIARGIALRQKDDAKKARQGDRR